MYAVRWLKPYFLAHPICVRMDHFIRQILTWPEASDWLTKWVIELSQYDLTYESRTSIKAQALACFLAEFTSVENQHASLQALAFEEWILYVDGSSNDEGSGAELLLVEPNGVECSYALRFNFSTSNNETEFEVVISNLWLTRELGAQHIRVNSDSQLMVR